MGGLQDTGLSREVPTWRAALVRPPAVCDAGGMTEGDPLSMLLWFSFLVPLIAFVVGAPLILRRWGTPTPPSPDEEQEPGTAPDTESG